MKKARNVTFSLSEDIIKRLDDYLKTTKFTIKKSNFVEAAIEELLRKNGNTTNTKR